MLKKIFKKILTHFKNPIESFFFDIRKLKWFYAKFFLTKIQKIYFPKTSFLINIDYIDLLNLWKNILKRRPKVILEVGSGYSTFLILAAMKKLNSININVVEKFYSLEQNKHYLLNLKKKIDRTSLNKVTFVLTKLKICKIYNTHVSICSNFPKDKINFFYEDRADDPKFNIAGDALKIETKMPEDYFICVDGMTPTVQFYKKHLKRKYKFSGGIFSGSNFEPCN
jgi:hypothetical protein